MMLKQFNEIASYAALIFVFMLILSNASRIPAIQNLGFSSLHCFMGLAAIAFCLMFANIGAPKIALS